MKDVVQQVRYGYICDNDYRNRDARYAGQASHKGKPDPLWDKRKVVMMARCFRPADFTLAEDRSHCVCPHGRTGLRQPDKQQAAPSLHIARARQGRWAVEALLPGAQHREVGSSRVCTMSGTDPGDTPLNACNGRTPTTEDERMTDSG